MCQRFSPPTSCSKKPLWKAKYNSVSQSPNITVSPNLVVDNTTVENVVRQLWPSRHTCEANQQLKILPFQSPCTGTELRGQVTPWAPHVNTHYNTIFNHLFCQRLLWLLLRTQDMGTSQSSVCQVLEFSHFCLDPTFVLRLRRRQRGLWQGLALVWVQVSLPPWTLSRFLFFSGYLGQALNTSSSICMTPT